MIAIHYKEGNNFSVRWKQFCEENSIPFKLISCYDNDILQQLIGCKALMWNVNNFSYKDQLSAKYIIKSAEQMNIAVFPNDKTVWHYDDKVAQKYLLESVNAPLVPSYVFYDQESANNWINDTAFPKVFKLRKGSGSKNVLLAKDSKHARRLVKKAFGKGFPTLDMTSLLKERIRKYKLGKESLFGVFKGLIRLFIGTPFRNMSSVERGYIYFQEFMPGNNSDQRIIVIGNKAFGLKRMVRKNDFRASGSGNFKYAREEFDPRCVQIAFETNQKLGFQCMAYDFVYDKNKTPKIVEISFAFNPSVYNDCPGYWDENLQWYNSQVNFSDWMVEDLLNSIA